MVPHGRILLVVLTVLQLFSFPGQFVHLAAESPDQAHLRWPLTVVAGLVLLCGQVVVVATWRLLTHVQADRIFTAGSLRWVDAILGAIGAAWALLTGLLTWAAARGDDPGGAVLLLLVSAGVGTAWLVVLVMRALLRQATTLRTELEGVV